MHKGCSSGRVTSTEAGESVILQYFTNYVQCPASSQGYNQIQPMKHRHPNAVPVQLAKPQESVLSPLPSQSISSGIHNPSHPWLRWLSNVYLWLSALLSSTLMCKILRPVSSTFCVTSIHPFFCISTATTEVQACYDLSLGLSKRLIPSCFPPKINSPKHKTNHTVPFFKI